MPGGWSPQFLASTAHPGVVQPDGTTVTINPATGIISSSGGSGINFADDETPGGVIDGTNTSFTLAHSPTPATSLNLFLNGVRIRAGADYTLLGAAITTTTPPSSNSSLDACYRY